MKAKHHNHSHNEQQPAPEPARPPQKSPVLWISLIVGPFAGLFAAFLAYALFNFVFDGASVIMTLANIILFLVGMVCIILLALMPLWIVMLVKTISQNQGKGLSKIAAILMAVFLSYWTWLYTYEKDKTKFWLNLGLAIVTLGLWNIVAWIWAIIDTATRPDEFYQRYPNYSTGSPFAAS